MSTTNELDLDIEKLFTTSKPLTEAELKSFGKKNREIMERPSFKAGILKDQFVHAVLKTLKSEGINQSDLARHCGKSRQALSKQLDTNKPGNFTIDTIVEIMHHLGRRVELHYPRNSEETIVIHCLKEEPVLSVEDRPSREVVKRVRNAKSRGAPKPAKPKHRNASRKAAKTPRFSIHPEQPLNLTTKSSREHEVMDSQNKS